MNGIMTDFFTVWEIDDDGKKATVRMTSSRKVRDDEKSLVEHKIAKNGYVNTSWSFVNFVGKAYNQLKKYEIKEGSRITKLNMKIQMEPYWDSKNEVVAYPKNPKLTVFEFELPETSGKKDLDKAPVVVEEEPSVEEEYPF
jgi:hypothetical protein